MKDAMQESLHFVCFFKHIYDYAIRKAVWI